MGSSPSSEGVLTGSSGCSDGLGLALSALSRATSIFSICSRIFTGLQDAVDSVGVVDRCSGTPVDRFELVYVDRCSVVGVDQHQCCRNPLKKKRMVEYLCGGRVAGDKDRSRRIDRE
ncbi:hypothetical protein F2Q70_00038361 [Brassica cretica]|uniref:Uncharacterized protein n=1 Tax=Brassica cretica TaxID=69181 RepID=A0A8S9KCZ8_BRACR|nr:hypothetical protein F2Q70_00038361 [Brassica cretica]